MLRVLASILMMGNIDIEMDDHGDSLIKDKNRALAIAAVSDPQLDHLET